MNIRTDLNIFIGNDYHDDDDDDDHNHNNNNNDDHNHNHNLKSSFSKKLYYFCIFFITMFILSTIIITIVVSFSVNKQINFAITGSSNLTDTSIQIYFMAKTNQSQSLILQLGYISQKTIMYDQSQGIYFNTTLVNLWPNTSYTIWLMHDNYIESNSYEFTTNIFS